MNRLYCRKLYHDSKDIISLCLESQCQGSRLLCVNCMEDHSHHQFAILDPKKKIGKMQILGMNHNCENKSEILQALYLRFDQISKITKKFEEKFKQFQQTIQKCIESVSETIIQTFESDTPSNQINKLFQMQYEEANQKANRIARNIIKLKLPHFQNQALDLIQLSQCIIQNIIPIFQKQFSIIFNSFDNLIQISKEYSLFNQKKDWLKTLNNYRGIIDKKQSQLISSLKLIVQNPQLQQNLNNQIKNKKSQQNIIPPTQVKGWQKLLYIGQLRLLKKLQLRSKDIQQIPNLSSLYSLLYLDLFNNKITKIQNLDKLAKLQTLGLGSNQISKIQNLQNLLNLKTLRLDKNKIKRQTLVESQKKLIKKLKDQGTKVYLFGSFKAQ